MNIICIGESAYNINLIMNKNNTSKIENMIGISLISSYLLSSWGEKIYYQGVIANDIYGEKILKELRSVNVNTKYITLKKDLSTTLALNIITDKSEEIINKEENRNIEYIDYKENMNIIFSDGSSIGTIRKIFKNNKKSIKILYVDNEKEQLIKVCEFSDYLIFTIKNAENITKIKFDGKDKKALEKIYDKLKEKFCKEIIIDLENNGTLFETDSKIKLMGKLALKNSYKKNNKDVFYGAFLYGLSNKLNIEKSIKIATITEYLSLKKSEKSIYIPKLEEVYEIYKKNK